MKNICFVIFLFLCLCSAAASSNELFALGNRAYEKEEYKQAIDCYQKCLLEVESTVLYYNLGNAYFREGEIGHSILAYERALVLSPRNVEANRNLAFVRKTAGLSTPRLNSLQCLARYFSLNVWVVGVFCCFWLAVGLFFLPVLYGWKGFWPIALRSFFASLTLLGFFAIGGYETLRRQSIILEGETPLRIAPLEGSPTVAYLMEGESVVVRKEHDSYSFVVMTNGKEGWVSQDKLAGVCKSSSSVVLRLKKA